MSGEPIVSLLDTRDDSPAARLAAFMSDLSEDCWCAGWLSDCEFALWSLANSGGGLWGMGVVSPDDAARLLALSEAAGGWVRWEDGVGAVFVPMDEWKGMKP